MRRFANALLIGLFLAAISVPTVYGLFIAPREVLIAENRRAHTCPTLERKTLKFFPQQFEMFFSDQLGFREELIAIARRWRWHWLELSPNHVVVRGEYGWLYHDFAGLHEDADTIKTRERLGQWQQMLETRHDWLAQRGIRSLTIIAPEKQTIYPECLPARTQRTIKTFTPHDAFTLRMQESPVPFLDLRPILRDGKTIEPMYHIRDTHWTPAGALRSTNAIMAETLDVFGGAAFWMPPYRGEVEHYTPDLTVMLGLPEARGSDPFIMHRPQPVPSYTVPEAMIEQRMTHIEPRWFTGGCPSGPVVMLVHDSFGMELAYHLAPHCSRLLCVPSNGLPTTLIEQERPALVIFEMAERHLLSPPATLSITTRKDLAHR